MPLLEPPVLPFQHFSFLSLPREECPFPFFAKAFIGTWCPSSKVTSDVVYDPWLTNHEVHYKPATVTGEALLMKMASYLHPQKAMPIDVLEVLYFWMDAEFGPWLQRAEQFSVDKAWSLLDPGKSAGLPYGRVYGPLKGDVMLKLGPYRLPDDFFTFRHVYQACPKVELLPEEKSSGCRMLLIANISSTLAGAWLFGAQNEVLKVSRHSTSYQIGQTIPGRDAYSLWEDARDLHERGTRIWPMDNKKNDAFFPAALISLLCLLRCSYLQPAFRKLAEYWYSNMYHICVLIEGMMLCVIGMGTGSLLTGSDNTLGSIALFMLACILKGFTLDEFRELFHVSFGDDTMWADPSLRLTPEDCIKAWTMAGAFLEIQNAPSFEQLKWLGTHPQARTIAGQQFNLYTYDGTRLADGFQYHSYNTTPAKRLAKMCALTQLAFADRDLFERLLQATRDYAKEWANTLTHTELAPLAALTEARLLETYLGSE